MKTKFYATAHFLLAWLARVIFLVIPQGRKNEPNRDEGPYLVCANHLSALDPVYICAVLRHQQPRFMSKAELFRIPVLRSLLKALGAYPVDRSGANAGVLKKTVSMLEEGYSVGMFPQGTRRPGQDPAETPVRNGAGLICEHSRAAVLPVYIKTKKNRIRFLRPVRVIVGKPVKYEEYTANGEYAKDTGYITKYLFDRVCELGREQDKGKK
ncbi:MAG: 1-acyl-sn-glycerol-3-phosphate acyltransferase [Clostridia bacterium]|nr:1-acyl-sn-glycerol-3-phosphate acyltransferase [Clostridia bacterium]